jgi:hypothetical protein
VLLYNVTTLVAPDIQEQWFQWMQESHIPMVMQTGCFLGYRIGRLLDQDESEGITYTIQYEVADRLQYENYIQKHAESLREDAIRLFGSQILSFRTLLEVVS